MKSAIALFDISKADAEDIMQEVSITLLDTLPKFDFNQAHSIFAFAHTIAKHRTIDFLRKINRRAKRDFLYESYLEIELVEPDQMSSIADRDMYRLLLDLIEKTPCEGRMSAVAKLITAGYSFSAIAEAMGINLATLKTQWRRFRIKLLDLHAEKFST